MSEIADFSIAQARAKTGEHEKALAFLKSAASACRGTAGGLLRKTRNPNAFAHDVFALHAGIMARTGKAEPIPGAGYVTFAVPPEGGVLVTSLSSSPKAMGTAGLPFPA